MDRHITALLKSALLEQGMDLVGFAPVDRWQSAPFLLSPAAVLPGSQSVIVAGIHITDTWTDFGGEPDPQSLGPGGWMDQNSFLDRVAYRAVRLLTDRGYEAVAVASSNIWRYRKIDGVNSWFAPDLSHMHAAAAAGLAEIGWSGLAITPEYGPRVRFISIVTNAILEPTPMFSGSALCDKCMDCVRACPSAAMRKDFDGQPHEVLIGDKTYKYANKNIWRCAWAEHFMLDLTSGTLKKDHIDESDIKHELATTPYAGHERGVCQKVCVPPHLRNAESESPVFRVEKKYRADMPTLKKLRDDVIARAVRSGVSLAASSELVQDAAVTRAIAQQVPGMTHVLAFAMRVPDEAVCLAEDCSYDSDPYTYSLPKKMHHILLVAARQLEEAGYLAASYTGTLHSVQQGNLSDTLAETTLDIDRHGLQVHLVAAVLAEMAGLGRIGQSFETPEFGPSVVVGAIVTNAPLDATSSEGAKTAAGLRRPGSPETLKAKILALADQHLVSLFGVSGTDRLDSVAETLRLHVDASSLGETVTDADFRMHGQWDSRISRESVSIRKPEDILPGARSVIVLGMHFPKEIINNSGLEATKQIGTYAYYNYQTTYELRFAAMEVAQRLQEWGYRTRVTENLLGVGSKVDTPRGILPDFRCGVLEAVSAGLGETGLNGGLLTREYGAHQRQIVIVTDAELPENPLTAPSDRCKQCGTCVGRCPVQALTQPSIPVTLENHTFQWPMVDRHRCDWAKRYSLHREEGPAMIGNTTHVEPPAGPVTIDMIAEACREKDEVMKKRTVILEPCLRWCPAQGSED